jgi:hypothetical protein
MEMMKKGMFSKAPSLRGKKFHEFDVDVTGWKELHPYLWEMVGMERAVITVPGLIQFY